MNAEELIEDLQALRSEWNTAGWDAAIDSAIEAIRERAATSLKIVEYEPETLGSCPEGLFIFEGEVGMKTEYRTESQSSPGVWQSDAYCVESGEYFWGGTSDPVERERLVVTPIDVLGPDSKQRREDKAA